MTQLADEIIPAFSHFIAFSTTILRLIHRKRSNRLWWDDLWALIALVFDTAIWIFYIQFYVGRGYLGMSRSTRMFVVLGIIYSYTTALWLARISIAVTIVRLLNPGKFRTAAKIVAGIFGLFWLVLVLQKIFRCGVKTLSLEFCPIPRTTGYIELATDILGDTWLVLAPAYMLWMMKISRIHRLLVLGIFSCSALTIGASVAHIYFIVIQSATWVGTTAHIQSGVSITVCNLLVLVTYVYRAFFNVQQNAAIPIRYTETREPRPRPPGTQPGPPVADASEHRPPAPAASESERAGVTMITLTDIESNCGYTAYTTSSIAPSSGNGCASRQVESFPSGPSIEISQLHAQAPFATV